MDSTLPHLKDSRERLLDVQRTRGGRWVFFDHPGCAAFVLVSWLSAQFESTACSRPRTLEDQHSEPERRQYQNQSLCAT